MRFHSTVEHLADGTSRVLYQGDDVTAAIKALEESIAEGKAFRVDRFFNPVPIQIRFPAQEKADAAKRAKASEVAKDTQVQLNAALAAAHRAQAEKLIAQAEKLEGPELEKTEPKAKKTEPKAKK
jgi:D-aminopeptidase